LYSPCNDRGKNLKIDWVLYLEENRSVRIDEVESPERMLPFFRVSVSKET
jgi:hypothetical protein